MRSCLPVFWLSSSSLTFSRLRVCEIHWTGKGARWGVSDRVHFRFCKCDQYFLHIAQCILHNAHYIWLTVGWSLEAAASRRSGLWSSSTHSRDIALFFQKPSLFFIGHQHSILPLHFILINCTIYKASWPWKLVHPHKRHCWVTTVTARGRDRETAIEVIAIILGHFCHHMVSRFCAVSSYFELQWRFC